MGGERSSRARLRSSAATVSSSLLHDEADGTVAGQNLPQSMGQEKIYSTAAASVNDDEPTYPRSTSITDDDSTLTVKDSRSTSVIDEVPLSPSTIESGTRLLPSPNIPERPSMPTDPKVSAVQSLLQWLEEGYNLADPDVLAALSWKYVDGVGVCLTDGDDPAHLTLVATISPTWFALTPDGGWEPGNSKSPTLQKHKASAYLVNPGAEPFDAIFERAIKNLQQLEALGCRDSYEIVLANKRAGLKFSWPLFEKVPSRMSDNIFGNQDDCTSADASAEDPWYGWVVKPDVVWHLHNIQGSHRPIPLPAWDRKGALIPPSQWSDALKGAVVKAKLIMKIYHFQDKKQSVVALEPVDLLVVMDPVIKSTSPIKNRDLKKGPSPSTRKRKPSASPSA